MGVWLLVLLFLSLSIVSSCRGFFINQYYDFFFNLFGAYCSGGPCLSSSWLSKLYCLFLNMSFICKDEWMTIIQESGNGILCDVSPQSPCLLNWSPWNLIALSMRRISEDWCLEDFKHFAGLQ